MGRPRTMEPVEQASAEATKLAARPAAQPQPGGEEVETMAELLADCRLQHYSQALQDEGYVLASDLSEAGQEELEDLIRSLGMKKPEARRLRAALSGRHVPEATPPAAGAAAAIASTPDSPSAPGSISDVDSPHGDKARLSMQAALVEIRAEIGIDEGENLSAQDVSDRAWAYLGLRKGRDTGMPLKEDIGRLCLQLGIATGWTIERRGGVGKLAHALVVFALAAADAPEVEAQDGEAHVVEGVMKVVDDLVVHRAAELRMRVQHDRDGGVFFLLGVVAAFEAAFGSWEDDLGHGGRRLLTNVLVLFVRPTKC